MTQAKQNNGRAIKSQPDFDIEEEVKTRYKAGAEDREASLCCPTSYNPEYLKVIPQEILERDYGCGDPSKYVNPGDVVLDLGSGGGKICYILSQIVGPTGRVMGVDLNDTMLSLARKYQQQVVQKIGHDNITFYKGKIQDLAINLDHIANLLGNSPIRNLDDLQRFQKECDCLRENEPMIPDDSVDVIVSNCVLNLVRPEDKRQLFAEMFRVLKRGGRAVISDIVCDEPPTEKIMNDPKLWSGCISGAFGEEEFLAMFEQAGFHGIELLEYAAEPWQTIDGIQFRSATVQAYKGKQGPCMERNQAVIYKGPWSKVTDDDGHTLYRGKRMAVCDKTFNIMTSPNSPYAVDVIPVEPLDPVPLEEAKPFNCKVNASRHPKLTKGENYADTIISDSDACCDPSTGCC